MNNQRKEDAKRAYSALIKVYPFMLDDLPGEEWLPVPDFPKYQVSNFGRVKRFFKNAPPKIAKPQVNQNGYLVIGLYNLDKFKLCTVHRLVAHAFIPNPEGKPQVNHIDGHKLNDFVGNLEWATSAENNQHAAATGLQKSGQDHHNAKLNNEQVLYIRNNPDHLMQKQLAEMFGLNCLAISNVQRGKTYRDVGGVIHPANYRPLKVSISDRKKIKAEYVFGSAEFGSYALAKKYNVCPATICNIIHEA